MEEMADAAGHTVHHSWGSIFRLGMSPWWAPVVLKARRTQSESALSTQLRIHIGLGVWGKNTCIILCKESVLEMSCFNKGASLLAQWWESSCKCRRLRFDPWVGKIPWRKKRQPTPVFLPGESHGQRKSVEHNLATKTVKKERKKEKESFVKWPCTVLWFKERECICRFLFVFLRSLLCIVRNRWEEEIIQRGDCFDSRSMLSQLCVISFGTTVKLRQASQAVLAEFWVLFMRAAYIRLRLDLKVQWVALWCGDLAVC